MGHAVERSLVVTGIARFYVRVSLTHAGEYGTIQEMFREALADVRRLRGK